MFIIFMVEDCVFLFFFFKQKTAYEMRISDWSSDVCSSDLAWKSADERIGPTITWSAFKAPEKDQDRRIDWVLTRGPISVSKCETVTFNRDGRYPSDQIGRASCRERVCQYV